MRISAILASRIGAAALLLLFLSCSKEKENIPAEAAPLVPVDLALSLQGPDEATRADVSYLTELADEPSFRGMQDIRLIPFARHGAVRADDPALSEPKSLPAILGVTDDQAYNGRQYHQGLIRNNRAHYFSDAYAILPVGTASVLVYGNGASLTGQPTPATKHLYGSLIEEGWEEMEGRTASDIRFAPDPILSEGALVTAGEMADMLTSIAGSATYTLDYYYEKNSIWREGQVALTWNGNIEDPTLRSLFNWFTNEGQLLTGAGGNLEYMLSVLCRRLESYSSDDTDPFTHTDGGVEYPAVLTGGDPSSTFTRAYIYEGLRDMLVGRIQALINDGTLTDDGARNLSFSDPEYQDYPTGLGLPEGAAVLRWNSLAFVPVTEGLDGIAPIDHFCYMPPLTWFVDTTLKTSNDHDIHTEYTQDKTWEEIVSQYRIGTAVTKRTAAVVLDNPMQYATGMLVATVKASTPTLPDADGDDRTYGLATGHNFPVTGIIIGSQFRQDYAFRPLDGESEYYLYDNRISGVYLTTTESADFRTLVLPVPTDTDVYFFLELRNDSNAAFTGADGVILPGSRFYLAGMLEKSDDPLLDRVFMQDYFTTVRCTVTSLANAHVSVPEMGQPQLALGVQTRLNWIMSASAYVVLD